MKINTKELRYICDQCDHAATDQSNLKNYIENKHKGVKYPCAQCEYAATTVRHLKVHIESKHEKVGYPRDQCEYAATRAINLKIHIENKHEGVRYPCWFIFSFPISISFDVYWIQTDRQTKYIDR